MTALICVSLLFASVLRAGAASLIATGPNTIGVDTTVDGSGLTTVSGGNHLDFTGKGVTVAILDTGVDRDNGAPNRSQFYYFIAPAHSDGAATQGRQMSWNVMLESWCSD